MEKQIRVVSLVYIEAVRERPKSDFELFANRPHRDSFIYLMLRMNYCGMVNKFSSFPLRYQSLPSSPPLSSQVLNSG